MDISPLLARKKKALSRKEKKRKEKKRKKDRGNAAFCGEHSGDARLFERAWLGFSCGSTP